MSLYYTFYFHWSRNALGLTLKRPTGVFLDPSVASACGKSSQVNFRLMAEYNISVSRLTELHSRFTSNKVLECRLKNVKIKVKQWSFIAYADVLATDEDC